MEIGLELNLLFQPSCALNPAIVYEMMAHSIIFGSIFANGKRLQMYLTGRLTGYVGARAMGHGKTSNTQLQDQRMSSRSRCWRSGRDVHHDPNPLGTDHSRDHSEDTTDQPFPSSYTHRDILRSAACRPPIVPMIYGSSTE
jgi:hypothetical protein